MKYQILIISLILGFIVLNQSCTHDPFMIEDIETEPIDTMTNPMDTMDIDTTNMGIPCDTNIIYFKNDILPILLGSCAFSGCHDAATATDGVILDNYDDVINTADVKAFDLSDSKLYEVITDDDPDDMMPPSEKLDNESINRITLWILQGAENLECDLDEDCDTVDASYSGFVEGVFSTSCNGCHSTSAAFGGVILDTYTDVIVEVENGKLYAAINWDEGFERMPQGQDQLDSCIIAKIKSWIDDGAQDN